MKSSQLFSFIIPALNEQEYIENCIRSIQQQADPFVEIIVVDNGSEDRTVEIAWKLGCQVAFEKKQGLSFARNRGALVAQGEILCFIDADCILSTHWLQAARQCFNQQKIGAVSGPSIYVHKNILKLFWYNLYMAAVVSGGITSSILFTRMIFAGNNLAIRRDLFNQVGGYEDVIGEGMWLSRRLWSLPNAKAKLCLRMIVWNSPRGFETLGFVRTVLYWVKSSSSRKSQKGYTYKTR